MSTKELAKKSEFFPTVINDFFKPWSEWYENMGFNWSKAMSAPSVNISEDSKDYLISVAVPGLKKEDFKIDVEGNVLTISSEKKEEKEEKDEKYSRKEYNYSSFSRSFTMPEGVNKEKIEATYENGILELVLPKSKTEKANPVRRIEIK
jgi:HSP20 family protein